MKMNDSYYKVIFRDDTGKAKYEFVVSPDTSPFGSKLKDRATRQLRADYEEEFANWCEDATLFLGYKGQYFMEVVDLDSGDACVMTEEAFDSLHDISAIRI